jgi:hypothetical protein
MKVSIVSESPADEAAIAILVEALLGRRITLLPPGRLRPGGWASALNVVDVELKRLHYNTDADAMVVVVDTDDTPLHEPAHEQPGGFVAACRLCQIRAKIESVRATLKPRYDNSVVRVAAGVAVPAIEAWYRCGLDTHAREDHFVQRLAANPKLFNVRNDLKKAAYGTDRPGLALERRVAEREARRLAADLSQLEQRFARGFGALARDVRGW